jgi:hypothetical protein
VTSLMSTRYAVRRKSPLGIVVSFLLVCIAIPSSLFAGKITILNSDATYASWRGDYAPQSLRVDSNELDLLLELTPKPGSIEDASQVLDMRYLPSLKKAVFGRV